MEDWGLGASNTVSPRQRHALHDVRDTLTEAVVLDSAVPRTCSPHRAPTGKREQTCPALPNVIRAIHQIPNLRYESSDYAYPGLPPVDGHLSFARTALRSRP